MLTKDSTELAKLLAEMNHQGNFSIAVLTDSQGLPIASAAEPGQDPDLQAAMVALIQRTALQVRQHLGLAQTDEISLYDAEGRRLVCRPFKANDHDMILAILITERGQSYRRLTNKVVNMIQQQWNL